MKQSAKVYVRLELISTKLPINPREGFNLIRKRYVND